MSSRGQSWLVLVLFALLVVLLLGFFLATSAQEEGVQRPREFSEVKSA